MGVGIIILLIIVVIAAILAIAFYATGTVLWARKTDPREDRIEASRHAGAPADADAGAERPRHTRPETEAQRNTTMPGAGRSGEPAGPSGDEPQRVRRPGGGDPGA